MKSKAKKVVRLPCLIVLLGDLFQVKSNLSYLLPALFKKSPDDAQMAVRVHVLAFKDYYFLHKASATPNIK
jgi:hypothetical protein